MTWEELYLEYSEKIYRYILLMVGNEETAEDLTHDTFVRVDKAIKTYKGNASYYTWLVSIARNVTYDYWRRKRKIRFLPLGKKEAAVSRDFPEELLLKEEEIQELYFEIKNLKWNYKEVIVLRKIQGLSIEETAMALGWSISKVKSTLQRALVALKEQVEVQQRKGGLHDGQKNVK
ncbi:RNA polymerase sigma factor [Bacillus alkalisoli]|uniref:RNA polymerase sigma factor n=1 Tax=Bacillus alkalisoli TaxID=2011008 RepID=UPI0012FF3EAA|nr:RNA polymerase sigma factor [Bacillus alkalisoli]